MLVSDCCGARALGNGDCDSEDMGICPNCLEHCSYIDETDGDIDPSTILNAYPLDLIK